MTETPVACVSALLGYLQPAAKLVTGHWWQGTWGQVALTHADTISTQYLHKSIAKFCRHIYQILPIIYYLHTLCSRGAPGLRQVTWWCVSWLPPTAPRHAPSPVTHVFHKNMKVAISSSGRAREPQKKCGLSFSIHWRFCLAQFTVALWKKLTGMNSFWSGMNSFWTLSPQFSIISIWNEFIPDRNEIIPDGYWNLG